MGSMRAQSSPALTELGAITRGRAALSHQIQTRVESIIHSYLTEGSSLKEEISEETIRTYSAQSTEVALQGSRPRDTFTSSDPYQTLYALVCIEREAVIDIFTRAQFIPPQHRASLRERARASFAELDQLLPERPQ